MSKPKLALIPSGYKGGDGEGTVYSILPNDGTGDFDYERDGNASRVRKDGLIEELTVDDTPRLDWLNSNCPSLLLEPQRTNLLKYSEDYSQSEWSKIRTTISTDQSIAPDGTFTADKIIASTDNNTHRCDQIITLTDAATYSLSFFAKANEYNCIRASIGQSGLTFGNVASFNLDTQSVSTIGTIENAEIVDFGNGWFRCILTMDAGTTDRVVIGLGNNNSYSFAGDTSSGLFMWGAMIEQASYPTSYIKSEASTETRLKDECFNGGNSDLFDITEGTFFVDVTPYKSDSTFSSISLNDDSADNRVEMFFYGGTNQVRFVLAGGGSGLSLDNYETITYNTRNKMAVTFNGSTAKVYLNGLLEHTDTNVDAMVGLDRLEFTLFNGTLNFEGKVHDTRVYDRVLTEAEAEELTTL